MKSPEQFNPEENAKEVIESLKDTDAGKKMEAQPMPSEEDIQEKASTKEESLGWMEKAKNKAEEFLPEIDPELSVVVEERTVTTFTGKPYNTVVLHFTHNINPEIDWTMEIEESDGYIDDGLEKAVKKAYEEFRG